MTQTIHRMYATREQAAKAAAELRHTYGNVFDFSAPEGEQAPCKKTIAAAMSKAHILNSHAAVLSERVAGGHHLVTVHAPFGAALPAIEALDGHGPVESGVSDPVYPRRTWDEATPVSSALNMPVLSKTKLPAERFCGVPSVTKQPSYFSSLLGLPFRSASTTPLSRMFNLPTLSRNATPFSTRFGFPLLSAAKRAR